MVKSQMSRKLKRNRTEGNSPSGTAAPSSSEVYNVSPVNKTDLDQMENRLAKLISDQLQSVSKRFNEVESKFDAVGERIKVLETKFSKIEDDMVKMDINL